MAHPEQIGGDDSEDGLSDAFVELAVVWSRRPLSSIRKTSRVVNADVMYQRLPAVAAAAARTAMAMIANVRSLDRPQQEGASRAPMITESTRPRPRLWSRSSWGLATSRQAAEPSRDGPDRGLRRCRRRWRRPAPCGCRSRAWPRGWERGLRPLGRGPGRPQQRDEVGLASSRLSSRNVAAEEV